MKTHTRIDLLKRLPLLLPLLLLSGCELVGDIFQAGLVVGIIGIVIALALIWWLIGLFRGRGAK